MRFMNVPLKLQQFVRQCLALLVEWLGQTVDPVVDIPQTAGVHEPEFVAQDRSGEEKPGRKFRDGALAEIDTRNEVGHIEFVFVADELAVQTNDTARAFSEL